MPTGAPQQCFVHRCRAAGRGPQGPHLQRAGCSHAFCLHIPRSGRADAAGALVRLCAHVVNGVGCALAAPEQWRVDGAPRPPEGPRAFTMLLLHSLVAAEVLHTRLLERWCPVFGVQCAELYWQARFFGARHPDPGLHPDDTQPSQQARTACHALLEAGALACCPL